MESEAESCLGVEVCTWHGTVAQFNDGWLFRASAVEGRGDHGHEDGALEVVHEVQRGEDVAHGRVLLVVLCKVAEADAGVHSAREFEDGADVDHTVVQEGGGERHVLVDKDPVARDGAAGNDHRAAPGMCTDETRNLGIDLDNGEARSAAQVEEGVGVRRALDAVGVLGPCTRRIQLFLRQGHDAMVSHGSTRRLLDFQHLHRRPSEDQTHFHDATPIHVRNVCHFQIDPHHPTSGTLGEEQVDHAQPGRERKGIMGSDHPLFAPWRASLVLGYSHVDYFARGIILLKESFGGFHAAGDLFLPREESRRRAVSDAYGEQCAGGEVLCARVLGEDDAGTGGQGWVRRRLGHG